MPNCGSRRQLLELPFPPGIPPGEKPAKWQARHPPPLTLFVHMYKGCTRDVQGSGSQAVPEAQASGEPEMPSGNAGVAPLGRAEGNGQSPMADGQVGTKAGVVGGGVASADGGGSG
jgi:hypothetical protein